MMKGHGELRLLLQVARIAKIRLRLDEQKLCLLRMVGRMARSTGNIASCVQGIDRLHVFGAGCVAGQASFADFFARVILENKDFRCISAALDMG
jgi:hypothetical protein